MYIDPGHCLSYLQGKIKFMSNIRLITNEMI